MTTQNQSLSAVIDRILTLEIVRVTERAAVAAAVSAGAETSAPPTRQPSTRCGASSTACPSTAPW